MKTYLPRTPRFIMRIFSKYTWRFLEGKKEIFLTFDDGPTPEITQFVLSELKKHNAKATFFCIGKNVQNHPEIYNTIIADGHAIGNHTQNHLNGWKTNTTSYIDNVLECEKTITHQQKDNSKDFKNRVNLDVKEINKPINTYKTLKTLQNKTRLFRPPYGKIKAAQAKDIIKRGYKIIMWSVLSADFDTTISKEKCLQNVLENTKNGSIIVFHDSLKAAEKMQYALPKVLKVFSDKGFIFKAIS